MGRKSRFSHDQIQDAFKQVEGGSTVVEVCRVLGIAPKTYYRWRTAFGGPEVSEAKHLKQLEEENRRLRRIVADQALNLQMLNDMLGRAPDPGAWQRDRNGRTPAMAQAS